MFEHQYEKDIASKIVYNYNQKRLACGNDKIYYHSIGILFRKLLKQLGINIEIIYKERSIQLITKSDLLDVDNSGKVQDLSPKITEDLNLHELRVVKFLQTISFLKTLEEQNYIIVLNCEDNPETPKPEVYDSYAITDHDMVIFINRLRGARIIPTTTLIEISAYDFKSVEKRQYDEQVKFNEEAISEARKANIIAEKSLKSAKKGNYTAITVAVFSFILTIDVAMFIPTSLTHNTIHEIGSEIHMNVGKETTPNIQINNYYENIDTTKYGKTTNEKP